MNKNVVVVVVDVHDTAAATELYDEIEAAVGSISYWLACNRRARQGLDYDQQLPKRT